MPDKTPNPEPRTPNPRVRVLRDFARPGRLFAKGEEVSDMDPALAKELAAMGNVEIVYGKAKA